MLFPELRGKRWAKIDLDLEAQLWLTQHSDDSKNSLLDPEVCEKFVADCHRRIDVDYSYGGWLEDRSVLWRGSYLDDDKRYVHLGVDYNVPVGTRVAVPVKGEVLRIDNDRPERYGWGNRVIISAPDIDKVIVFAHLANFVACTVGDVLEVGKVFAQVGTPLENGGWFPHLHVQMIIPEYYQELLRNDLRDLDGYGHRPDYAVLGLRFPNPRNYLEP